MNIFLIISVVLPLIGTSAYIYEILYKDVRPNIVTWGVWFLISLVSTVSLYFQQSNAAVYFAAIMALQPASILLLSLKKHGITKWILVDKIALILALLGIIAWIVTNNPLLALLFSIFADFSGLVPTLVKAYTNPFEESYIFFLLDSIASIANLIAVGSLFVSDAIYPAYLFMANVAVVIIIVIRRRLAKAAVV